MVRVGQSSEFLFFGQFFAYTSIKRKNLKFLRILFCWQFCALQIQRNVPAGLGYPVSRTYAEYRARFALDNPDVQKATKFFIVYRMKYF